ncbi:MAG: PKD domain-containing protein [Acidimicrobiia bacterium]
MSRIVRWHSDFGDGATSTEQNPKHTYDFPGTYSVTQKVWNAAGIRATKTKKITVTGDVASGGPLPEPREWI